MERARTAGMTHGFAERRGIRIWTAILLLVAARDSIAREPDIGKVFQGPPFPRIANVYGTCLTPDGGSFHGKPATLNEVARYDLLVGVQRRLDDGNNPEAFRRRLEQLKQINPHLIALHFACSAPYTHMAPPEDFLTSRKPRQVSPWLLQTDGRPIAGWPGTYMLNLAVPGAVEWLAGQTVPAVQDIGYDGVFIDCMGPHFDSWACEIATGKAYTVDSDADGDDDDRELLADVWTAAKTKLAGRTRELIGSKAIFMANQAGEDTYPYLNGIYLEDYIDAVLDRGMSWERVLEKYLHWTKIPRLPNVTVLGCSSGVEPPFRPFKLTAEQRASYLEQGKSRHRRMRFGLTTTLMGDGYYSFDLHTRWRGQSWWYPEFDAPLRYPTGPGARRGDGTWQRPFEGGLVVVNPTAWDATVELAGRHQDASSGQVDRHFVVPCRDGRIFLPTTAPIQAGTLPPIEPQLTATGPAGVVRRDGNAVLRDGRGAAILIGPTGSLDSFCLDGQERIDAMGAVIVADDRWRDFAVEDLRAQVNPAGHLILTGRRTHADQEIEFKHTFRLADGRLAAEYYWRAMTRLKIRAFRQYLRLSPRVFGGTLLHTSDDRKIHLPETLGEEPSLAKGITTAHLQTAEDATVTIRLPQQGQLIDDRHYNGSGYLLAFYPIAGAIPKGTEWSSAIEVHAAPGD